MSPATGLTLYSALVHSPPVAPVPAQISRRHSVTAEAATPYLFVQSATLEWVYTDGRSVWDSDPPAAPVNVEI